MACISEVPSARISAGLKDYLRAVEDAQLTDRTKFLYKHFAEKFVGWLGQDYSLFPKEAVPWLEGYQEDAADASTALAAYTRAFDSAVEDGLAKGTRDFHVGHAEKFVRWLGGDFVPGKRRR